MLNLSKIAKARDILTAQLEAQEPVVGEPVRPASKYAVPFTTNLFGPVQSEGSHLGAGTKTWAFPGSALSASTKLFWASAGFAPVKFARWVVIWAPGSSANKIRLIHADDGPSNITGMSDIWGENTSNPRAVGAMITSEINELIEGKKNKHLGFQVSGNSSYRLYEVRIELVFEIG